MNAEKILAFGKEMGLSVRGSGSSVKKLRIVEMLRSLGRLLKIINENLLV